LISSPESTASRQQPKNPVIPGAICAASHKKPRHSERSLRNAGFAPRTLRRGKDLCAIARILCDESSSPLPPLPPFAPSFRTLELLAGCLSAGHVYVSLSSAKVSPAESHASPNVARPTYLSHWSAERVSRQLRGPSSGAEETLPLCCKTNGIENRKGTPRDQAGPLSGFGRRLHVLCPGHPQTDHARVTSTSTFFPISRR